VGTDWAAFTRNLEWALPPLLAGHTEILHGLCKFAHLPPMCCFLFRCLANPQNIFFSFSLWTTAEEVSTNIISEQEKMQSISG
jgi:hypothetical protein